MYIKKGMLQEFVFLNVLCRTGFANNIPLEKLQESRMFESNWTDLDTRPLPQWYASAKIGIFVHWGIYSVPSTRSEWFWAFWKGGEKALVDFMAKNYPKDFRYEDFAPMLTGEFYDPNEWAELFYKSGAKYVVLTTKHHDGYSLFRSDTSDFNSVELGPKIDVTSTLAKAVRNFGLKFGTYYSLYEWNNDKYRFDRNVSGSQIYVKEKVFPDIKQLINDYKPSVLWSDGDWEVSDAYWNSTDILAWLYNESPVKDEIVVNDRWGYTYCVHGDFYNCEDRYLPRHLMNHAWENALTLDLLSWGFRRDIYIGNFMTIEELLHKLMLTICLGGNILINVGPTAEGIITPIYQERLLQLGSWLKINGEAIYDTSPCAHQYDDIGHGEVYYTCRKKEEYTLNESTIVPCNSDSLSVLYVTFLSWPFKNVLTTNGLRFYLKQGIHRIDLLGSDNHKNLLWALSSGTNFEKLVKIYLPSPVNVTSRHGWTLKITRIESKT